MATYGANSEADEQLCKRASKRDDFDFSCVTVAWPILGRVGFTWLLHHLALWLVANLATEPVVLLVVSAGNATALYLNLHALISLLAARPMTAVET